MSHHQADNHVGYQQWVIDEGDRQDLAERLERQDRFIPHTMPMPLRPISHPQYCAVVTVQHPDDEFATVELFRSGKKVNEWGAQIAWSAFRGRKMLNCVVWLDFGRAIFHFTKGKEGYEIEPHNTYNTVYT